MTNKRVHWSQYADEISFLTIRDVVRLTGSVDDEYFSDEDIQTEELKVIEKEVNEKRRKRGLRKEPFAQNEFRSAEIYPLRSPTVLARGKSHCNYLYDTESSASDDSIFYDDINFTEGQPSQMSNKLQKNYLMASKSGTIQEPKFRKNKKHPRDEELGDKSRKMGYMNISLRRADESTQTPDIFDSKIQDKYWISPHISLSRLNPNFTKGDYSKGGRQSSENRKSESQSTRSRSSNRWANQNTDECSCGISRTRSASKSRKDRRDLPETVMKKKSVIPQFEFIEEDMKPNRSKPRVTSRRSRSTSKTPCKNHYSSKHSSKTTKK